VDNCAREISESPYRGTTMKNLNLIPKSYPLIVRYRRSIAATLAALGVLLLGSTVVPKQDSAIAVLVATKQLAAGSVLTQEDFRLSELNEASFWESAASDPDELIGRTLARNLAANQPISSTDVIGPGLLDGLPKNYVAVSLPLSTGTNTLLLNLGSSIDIYVATNDGLNIGTLVASRAIILAKPTNSKDSLFAGSSQSNAIIIGVDSFAAASIAGNMNSQGFTIAVLQ
jgi:pilus assembly protein CpaB